MMTQYQMTQDAALRLMRDGGQLLAVAIMTRGRNVTRGLGAETGSLRAALRKANKLNVGYRETLTRLQKLMED